MATRAVWCWCGILLLGGGCGGQTGDSDPNVGADAAAGRGGSGGVSGSQAGGNAGLAGSSGVGGGGGQGGAACPGDATSCPAGCNPMGALPYDAARQCVVQKSLIVGCTSQNGGTADAPCVKRVRDGALFIASSGSMFLSSPAWIRCTDEESKRVSVSCPPEPCAQGSVSTAEGCMTCDEARRRVSDEQNNIRTKLSLCSAQVGCSCVPDDTLCAGSCPVAIANDSVDVYAGMLAELGKAYCSDPNFLSTCGRVAPRCVACTASCVAGMCTTL